MSRETFDRDAMRLDDIVEDDVRPFLTLQVEKLTSRNDGGEGEPESRPDGDAGVDEPASDRSGSTNTTGAEGLEVYGWESSLWRRVRGYLGF